MLSKISYQVKAELKHNFFPLVLVNLITIGISYFIFGLKNLDINVQGIIIERFLPLTGIFSLVTILYPEHQSPIKDILVMRNTSIEFIYLLRFFISFLFCGIVSFIYIYLLTSGEPIYRVLEIFFHSLSIGAAIGVVGLLVFSLTNNISLAFLASIGLMLAQWFAPKDNLNFFLLFTMPKISVSKIGLVFGICFVILILSINIWKKKTIS